LRYRLEFMVGKKYTSFYRSQSKKYQFSVLHHAIYKAQERENEQEFWHLFFESSRSITVAHLVVVC
jgi:hypothetical protein